MKKLSTCNFFKSKNYLPLTKKPAKAVSAFNPSIIFALSLSFASHAPRLTIVILLVGIPFVARIAPITLVDEGGHSSDDVIVTVVKVEV